MKKLILLFAFCLSTFAQFGPSIDPRINGAQDDGSSEGVVKSKITRGQLVKVSFVDSKYYIDNVGGSAGSSFSGGLGPSNPDGSGTQLFISCPNNSSQRLVHTFYGSVYGVRWVRGAADFCVVIDGISYRVKSQLNEPENVTAIQAAGEYENLTVIADDLPDAPHVAEIVFVNSTGSSLSWTLYGFLAEARVGHSAPTRVSAGIDATTVPNTDTAIMSQSFRSLRKVIYYNTDSVTRTITIKQNSKVIKVITLTASTGSEWDLGDFVGFYRATGGSGLSHAADAASVVNFYAIGGL